MANSRRNVWQITGRQ